MRYYFYSIIIIAAIFIGGCSQSQSTNTVKGWKYFKIFANAEDDKLFVDLQNELGIYPLMTNYIVIVDIRDAEDYNKKITIGEPDDPSSFTRQWQSLSVDTRNGLIKWSGSNKYKM